ncbi:hypothetical protein L210DRAFT_3653134 [Boletus edulis BED1]|uniref:Uncharacterized protein n=1 Tax=Boletus edulis BED1 TaxID=1328754 RepID=A0AAD4G7C3_BOLED|nr:hypothetical protein L210DRAFT_3653134 [Boletus edulis BED1]
MHSKTVVVSTGQVLSARTYRVLLFLEALMMAMWTMVVLFIEAMFLSRLPPYPHRALHFWLLSGISALMLFGGIYNAAQGHWLRVLWWRIAFVVSFFAGVCSIFEGAYQGRFLSECIALFRLEDVSEMSQLQQTVIISFGLAVVHIFVADSVYAGMTGVVTSEDFPVFILHQVYLWCAPIISAAWSMCQVDRTLRPRSGLTGAREKTRAFSIDSMDNLV